MPISLKARRKYRRENKDHINQKDREWRTKNKKKVRKYKQKYKKSKNYRKMGREASARHRRKYPDQTKNYMRRWREKVIAHYGGKCACCEIDTYEFLSIDHMSGHGKKHRDQLKRTGQKLTRWLINNNYPKGFQILCHNCNQSLGHYGFCPHRPDIIREVLH